VERNTCLLGFIDPPQGDGWLGLEGHVIGNASPTAALDVLAPFLGQIKLPVDVPGVVGIYITGGDHHLAIGRFAQDPSVLGGDAHGVLTLAWVSGVIHDQNTIASHHPFQHDLDALPVESLGIPTGLGHEPIEG
jgi:hypothetical protein